MKITKTDIILAVKKMMSNYGFQCQNGEYEDDSIFSFEWEPPTGMAAFSQSTVHVYIRFWSKDLREIDVGICYEGHHGEDNRWSESFHVVSEKGDQKIKLFSSEDYNYLFHNRLGEKNENEKN